MYFNSGRRKYAVMSQMHCAQPTMYKFFCYKIEIKIKTDLYMPCEAMAHSTKSTWPFMENGKGGNSGRVTRAQCLCSQIDRMLHQGDSLCVPSWRCGWVSNMWQVCQCVWMFCTRDSAPCLHNLNLQLLYFCPSSLVLVC